MAIYPDITAEIDTATAHGIISENLNNLKRIDKKINDYMYATVENYNAERWGDIIEHPTQQGMFLLVINDDSRKPLDSLNVFEKINRVQFNSTLWTGQR